MLNTHMPCTSLLGDLFSFPFFFTFLTVFQIFLIIFWPPFPIHCWWCKWSVTSVHSLTNTTINAHTLNLSQVEQVAKDLYDSTLSTPLCFGVFMMSAKLVGPLGLAGPGVLCCTWMVPGPILGPGYHQLWWSISTKVETLFDALLVVNDCTPIW